MTREQQLEIIRAACVAANPNAAKCTHIGCDGHHLEYRLADVLLAICDLPKATLVMGEGMCVVMQHPKIGGAYYNLRADDLTQQSDECITFLADLLANNTSNDN